MIKATPNPEDIQLAGPGQENFGDNPSQWKGKRAKQSFILDSPSKVTPIVKKSSSFVIYSECNQEGISVLTFSKMFGIKFFVDR